MDARAPAVVAAVVATEPGDWFEETLTSLGAQDYQELSVVVLVPEGSPDLPSRVAQLLPDAYIRPVAARSFGTAVNELAATVEGAAFFLLCHDDVALAPEATRLLVEESFRSNAGVVAPKTTRFDDSRILVHVGQGADKTGAVVDRVQAGEVDHGQHDGVRDVFVAPGGCVLVRADLFQEIGGFDPVMPAAGEDLDFSWRAQIAGARIVVAPEARVRHLEAIVSGVRPVPTGDVPAAGHDPELELERLRRRHELRTVVKCYSWVHLARVLPQMLVLLLVDTVAALVSGDPPRAGAALGAWTWNLRHLGEVRELRRGVRSHRAVKDREIRRLQVRGSVRLSAFFVQLAHQGFELVRGASARTPVDVAPETGPELTGSVGGAFSEDSSFDEIADTPRVRRPPPLSTPRSRLLAWLLVAAFLVVGTRQLLSAGLPEIGQFVPLPSWGGAWHFFAASWQPAGVGTAAPTTPAFAVLGSIGTVLLGGMGLVQKVAVLGCVPLGAWGLARLLRPLCSPRVRLVAAVAYLGLPLAYDSLARGRWDALVAYAVTPWIVGRLARASEEAPYAPPAGWRGTLAGQMLTLGVVEAVAVSFAPAVWVVVVLVGLALPLGSLACGRPGGLRALMVAVGGSIVAALLCAPWVIGILAAGHGAVSVLGLPTSASSATTWSSIIRFAVGPVGGSPLGWFLPLAALLPLLVAQRARLGWAARFWAMTLLGWVVAWLVARHSLGSFAPAVGVVLAPAACGVAAAIGVGLAAFERDLPAFRFGWRQMATVVALGVAGLGLLPVVAEAGDGRWGLPETGFEQPLAYLAHVGTPGGGRVLWLGDPRALPGGGWSVEPGLAYATTEGGTPGPANLFAAASPGPAARLAAAVRLAAGSQTTQLGHLLAPAGVRYVVLLEALAPSAPGLQIAPSLPAPAAVARGLDQQLDLRTVPGGEGFTVYADAATVPLRAERPAGFGAVSEQRFATPFDVVGWRGVLPGAPGSTSYTGTVRPGTVSVAYAPSGRWHLTVGGRALPARPAHGWAAQYRTAQGGAAVLAFDGGLLPPLGTAYQVLLWVLVGGTLLLVGRARRPRPPRASGSPARPARPRPTPRHVVPSAGGAREPVEA